MHPDLLRALARARQDDLLNTYPAPTRPKVRLSERLPLVSRTRHRVGALLIRTGVRLSGDRQSGVELAN